MLKTPSVLLVLSIAASASAQAQTPGAPLQNVLQVSASASAEIPQDLLAVTLTVQRDGTEATVVQSQLKQVLDAALTEARKAARPGLLDVRTGSFSVSPRYSIKAGISGWQGRADLILEGRDITAISQLSGRLPGLVVTGVGHGLSREAREKAEAEVAAQAIARFRARAESYARQFGFAGYTIREVSVGQADAAVPVPRMRAMAVAAAGAAEDALPVEAGRTTVTVNVGGSIQMTK